MTKLQSLGVQWWLFAIAAVGLVPSPGAASPPKAAAKKAPAPTSLPKAGAAPKALSPAKRLEAVNSALAKAKQVELAQVPAALPMRLTPMTTRLENGARITEARQIDFVGATTDSPDGMYWLLDNAAEVSISIPTEVGKVYVIDCRAFEWFYEWGVHGGYRDISVGVMVDYAPQQVQSVDGHVMTAFAATKSETKIKLDYLDPEPNSLRALAFWDCDAGAAT